MKKGQVEKQEMEKYGEEEGGTTIGFRGAPHPFFRMCVCASQSAFISITSMSTTFPELEDGICLLRACQAFCQQRWKVDLSARCVMT